MRALRPLALALSALCLAACHTDDARTEITLQRFFGDCGAAYGQATDVAKAEGECGIITTLVNRFNADNPDVRVKVSIVPWPGYDQLSAQFAAGDPPDLVVVHDSAISDYQSRHLFERLDLSLPAAGVDPRTFTRAARLGVTKGDGIYGMPFDNWAMLWHINMNEFRRAGLVRDGRPVLPRSPEELLAQARQFKARTGKPYLIQAQANETAAYTRNLYTYLMGQNAVIFPDPKHISLRTPQARRVVELFRQINAEKLTTLNQDYTAATGAFTRGEGGVYLVGTWVISDFQKEAQTPGRPLYKGYAVTPYPQLYARDATFVDGHAWAVPVRHRTPAQRAAVFRLLKFLADHDFQWSRTGHIPAFQPVLDSAAFRALPQRQPIASLAVTGSPLPPWVQRQFAIQDILGEEMAAAISDGKPVDTALADAERRVNELLYNLI